VLLLDFAFKQYGNNGQRCWARIETNWYGPPLLVLGGYKEDQENRQREAAMNLAAIRVLAE
jgi:hypothetical protein